MKGIAFLPGFIGGFIILGIVLPASSQVTSDNITNTTINTNNNNFTILNGIQKGNNLFHSFKEFSIPKGDSVTFNNSTDVLNIINRVTGGNVSNIDGLIKANGNANLFLINPAGIVFGENARLDIGGSFLGSTAQSILFEDGFNYSAIVSPQTPLLTVSAPLGLQMGANPSSIQVNNAGHELSAQVRQPLTRGSLTAGLSVNAGNTLALVGGELSITGGIIRDRDGRVELGAVTSPDVVYLNPKELGWKLDYRNVSQFGDIHLKQQTLVETSDIGAIKLQGQNILFQDGSILLIENRSNQPAVGIDIKSTGTVEFVGTTADKSLQSGAISDAVNSGRGGDISISAKKIVGRDNGGEIRALTFADADSGNIRLSAKDIVWREGEQTAAIAEIRTLGTGNGGILELNTERLFMQDSAFVSTVNNSSGSAGNIIVNATESVELAPNINLSTIISSSAVGGNGDAGNITINTKALSVAGGAVISSSTFGGGNAGNIIINARETLSVKGSGRNGVTFIVEPTTIRTAGILLPEAFLQSFGLPLKVTGNAGTIEINTDRLQIEDGALVTVRHDSLGNAGNLEINADSAILNDQGKITASTVSGEGGNINLNLQSSLILRNNSLIDTESFNKGNGGNITINSPVITALENSDIIASAVEGNGGNINIKTQGLLGLEFSEQLTEESDITSSSEFGLNGQVMLEQLDLNPVASLIELPSNFENTTTVQAGCRASGENQFIFVGKGALPQSPNDLFHGSKILIELLPMVNQGKISSNISSQNHSARVDNQISISPSQNPSARVDNQKNPIIEATGFIRNSKGEVELVAARKKSFHIETPDCS